MKPLIIANWKCNPVTLVEAKRLSNGLKLGLKKIKNVEVVICPPFVFLSSIQYPISNIKLGAQDCFWEEKGAFTGEISPPMLKNLGCEYVIIGHSEHRQYFGETDELINKKLKAAINAGLKPILCIGETEEQRKRGQTNRIIQRQLVKGLRNIQNFSVVQRRYQHNSAAMALAIAYEPVWAIGTGNPCLPKDAKKTNLFIQKILAGIYNKKIAKTIRILYGGSVNSKNAAQYLKEAKMHGLLVGGASLNPEEFTKIIKSCAV